MEIEAFKISCRAIYPDCVFYDNPLGLVLASTNKNGYSYKRIALLDIESLIPSVAVESGIVKGGIEYIQVPEDRFIKEIDKIKKNGLL